MKNEAKKALAAVGAAILISTASLLIPMEYSEKYYASLSPAQKIKDAADKICNSQQIRYEGVAENITRNSDGSYSAKCYGVTTADVDGHHIYSKVLDTETDINFSTR